MLDQHVNYTEKTPFKKVHLFSVKVKFLEKWQHFGKWVFRLMGKNLGKNFNGKKTG